MFHLAREHPQDVDLVRAERSILGLGGEQLAAGLREVRRDLPVVLLVDGDGQMAPARAAALGLAGVLVKPVSTAALTQALRRALDTGTAFR